MGNLFSSFDPQASIFFIKFSFNWVSATVGILLIPQLFWITKNQFTMGAISVARMLLAELSAVFGSMCLPGTSLFFLAFFFFILSLNFMGLFPYIFTPSSHFVFTLTLSLPLWLGGMVWATALQFSSVMAHLVPQGTPPGLMPVMVLIETVSSIIRPMTLAIRLAANMVAGHLLLTLLGSQGTTSISGGMMVLLVALVLLLTLECAVACIQSYVFTILSSLYLNELTSVSFSKAMVKI